MNPLGFLFIQIECQRAGVQSMDVIVKWVYRSWSMGFATATNICSWGRGRKWCTQGTSRQSVTIFCLRSKKPREKTSSQCELQIYSLQQSSTTRHKSTSTQNHQLFSCCQPRHLKCIFGSFGCKSWPSIQNNCF